MIETLELEGRFCGNELCVHFKEAAPAASPASSDERSSAWRRGRHLYVTRDGNRFHLCDCCHYAVWLAQDALPEPK